MRKCSIILLMVCAWATANDVIYILSSPQDRHIKETFDRRVAQLKNCGISVETVQSVKPSDWKKILSKRKSLQKTLVMVEGHGFVVPGQLLLMDFASESEFPEVFNGFKDQETLKKTIEAHSQNVTPVSKLFDALVTTDQKPTVWMDTCFSGACRNCEKIELGTACGALEKSFDENQLTDTVIALLCSGHSDCELWRQVDTNGDGLIKSHELRSYWEKHFGKILQVQETAYFPDGPADRVLEQLKKEGVMDLKVTKVRPPGVEPLFELKYRIGIGENASKAKAKAIAEAKLKVASWELKKIDWSDIIRYPGISVPTLDKSIETETLITQSDWQPYVQSVKKAFDQVKGKPIHLEPKYYDEESSIEFASLTVTWREVEGEIEYQGKRNILFPFPPEFLKGMRISRRNGISPTLEGFTLRSPRCDRTESRTPQGQNH